MAYRLECTGIFRSHGVVEFSFCCHLPFPDLPHPPIHPSCVLGVVLEFKVVSQFWLVLSVVSISCQPFISCFCPVILVIFGDDIKGQNVWSAWCGSQLCVRTNSLYERRSSQLQTRLLQLRKESLKNCLGLYGIRTLDLCDNGAALYQLSEQANWEQVAECFQASFSQLEKVLL